MNKFEIWVDKINKWGYTDKRGVEDIPDQDRTGVKMPWDFECIRIAKRCGHQIWNARWYGWMRFLFFFTISALFHFPLKWYLRNNGYEADQVFTIPVAMCLFYLLMFLAEWKWGIRESSRIRCNTQRKVVTVTEGDYSYSRYMNLHTRDLLVLAIISVGDYLINGIGLL